jgi:hypothetical protein
MLTSLAFAIALAGPDNTLSTREVRQGWKLLFDGQTTKGWHNFRGTGVKPGWVIENGELQCKDPHNAGDILTDEKYEWFELQLDWKMPAMQNSGIMFHVLDSGGAPWFSGPEIQIMDKAVDPKGQLAGFLYELYRSDKDAVKPIGEWNHFRIMIDPKKSFVEVNGVRYFDFVLNSPDFLERVAKSKFKQYPEFGKAGIGHIAIQGDHGLVSFKNIKIRPLKVKATKGSE